MKIFHFLVAKCCTHTLTQQKKQGRIYKKALGKLASLLGCTTITVRRYKCGVTVNNDSINMWRVTRHQCPQHQLFARARGEKCDWPKTWSLTKL